MRMSITRNSGSPAGGRASGSGTTPLGTEGPLEVLAEGRLIADLIAITVDRARLTAMANERVEWAERVSHTDALTGLANARTLSRILELEVARASLVSHGRFRHFRHLPNPLTMVSTVTSSSFR